MKVFWVCIFLICLLGGILRTPQLNKGLPYFFHEDEAHHFNRLVEMGKSGDLNPNYFHKPTFHFYMRLLPLYLTVGISESRGNLTSIDDIITRYPGGWSGYYFTTSHPGIVKATRGFGLILSFVTILLTAILAFLIFRSLPTTLFTAFSLAISPALIETSSTIGVDSPVTFLCVLSSLLCYMFFNNGAASSIIFGAITTGLATSTKYNAAPICVLPIFSCLLRFGHLITIPVKFIILSLLLPIIGFFLGSPYILFNYKTFIDHVSYEIWHYGIAGHVGHTGTPGLNQALFYLKYICQHGLGYTAIIASIFGIALNFKRYNKEIAFLLCFPLLYLLLMSLQKANFTRNMLVMIPYFAIFNGSILNYIVRTCSKNTLYIVTIFLVATSSYHCFQRYEQISSSPLESRRNIENIVSKTGIKERLAISNKLQIYHHDINKLSLIEVDLSNKTISDLISENYKGVIIGPNELQISEHDKTKISSHYTIPGDRSPIRIPNNPELTLLVFIKDDVQT